MPESSSPTITRVVLVTPGEGAKEFFADSWDLCVQDDGRTVKLFAKGDGRAAQAEATKALAQDLTLDPEYLEMLARRARGEHFTT